MIFEAKVVLKSKKEHRCLLCLKTIPVGSIYVVAPYKDDESKKFEAVKMCSECAYLMHHVTKTNLKEGNFTETNIPNFLRKIRNEYRKNPQETWEKFQTKGEKNED